MTKSLFMLCAGALLCASPALAAETLSLAPFSGISAEDGARVIVRYGASQQVTITEGSTQYSRVEVRGNGLQIEGCSRWCPHDYRLTVEIVTPQMSAVKAEDGASITFKDGFPAQGELSVSAEDGGDIDARALHAQSANAKADDGGNIQLTADNSLNAEAEDGGNITYWGHPTVRLHMDDGGSVNSGS